MILTCSSCSKKFVVPDQAITSEGRMVQCGSCGNKWKQFPVKNILKKSSVNKNPIKDNIVAIPKKTKTRVRKIKKVREINLYSPEYLEKKHGIKLNNKNITTLEKNRSRKKVSFGFYNSLVVLIVLIIAFTKILHFSQDLIISKFPFTEIYLDILFENIKNLFEIIKSLIIIY